jgi:uncharacterized cupin superfamily protein
MPLEASTTLPTTIEAIEAPARTQPSNYPEPFASRMKGRTKRPLGDLFGLANFGVNLTTLEPKAVSALQHRHSRQDEFVYILEGEAVLVTGATATVLGPGMCAGFKAGGISHHLENRSEAPVTYLEIGDRTKGDEVSYLTDDLVGELGPQGWVFRHKDGSPY